MNEDEKRRFDAIAQLYQRSWEQFNARRQYEFRVGLAYWAALVAASAGSVNIKSFPQIPHGKPLLIGFAIAIILLHMFWMRGIWRAHGTDQMIAIHYQTHLQNLSQTPFASYLAEDIMDRSKDMGRLRHPAALFEVGLTALLALAFVGYRLEPSVRSRITFTARSGGNKRDADSRAAFRGTSTRRAVIYLACKAV